MPSCIPVSPGGTCPVFILQWTRQQAFYPRHPRTLQILLLERQLVDQVPPLLKISARNDAILNNSASTCSRILAMLMWEPAARRVIVHRQQQIIAVRDLGAAISTAGADFSRPWEKLTPRQHEGPQCYYLWPPSLSDQRAQLRPRGSHNDLLQVVGATINVLRCRHTHTRPLAAAHHPRAPPASGAPAGPPVVVRRSSHQNQRRCRPAQVLASPTCKPT